MKIHQMPIRIYYQDTDAGGIVYHANYLDFAERARSQLLYDVGLSNKKLLDRGIAFVIRKANIEYFASAHLEDDLMIKTTLNEIKNASMTVTQNIFRGDKKLVGINLQIAFINPKTMKPARLPDDLKKMFAQYVGDEKEK